MNKLLDEIESYWSTRTEGYSEVNEKGQLRILDLGVSKRIYQEKDEFYNPTPLFALAAKKA